MSGSVDFGLFDFPTYQVFVLGFAVLLCVAVWRVLTRTRIGMVVRASTERPDLTRALGIDVGRWVTPVFGFGIGARRSRRRAGRADARGQPAMGADLIIVVFAVVVIGGLGSIFGSVAAGFGIGLVQAWGEAYLSDFPIVSQTIVFVVMAGVLLWRPAGLFGREEAPA